MDFQLQNQRKPETTDNFELLKSLLYPETLENSKIIGILSDDLSFQLTDLYSISEIKRLIENEEQLISIIQNSNFLQLDNLTKTCRLDLIDSHKVYSLINIPSKMEKDELIKALSFSEFEIIRIHKKYFVWMIVLDSRHADRFENHLKYSSLGEEKVKFEVTTGISLKETILKRINYLKESFELKANPENNNGKNNNWRKRSSETEDKKFKKHSKADSNYGSNYSSNSSVTNNHYDFKRRRFNSDGASENVIENPQKQNTRITMSNQIKFRYSIREMKDIIMLNYNYFEQKPNFVNEIEEICSNVQRKKINILGELDSKRDRSNTINYQAYEFKNKFNESKKSFNIPKNNPLQNIDNIDFNNNNTNGNGNGNYNNHYKYSSKKYDNYYNYNSNSYGNYKNKFDLAN